MFTGLVEEVGTVTRRTDLGDAAVLTVAADTVLDGLRPGDSVAVAGVCLTVTTHDDHGFTADVMPETLRRTTLGALAPGHRVNLERPVRPDGRLGGHLVQGHVDGVGTVLDRRPGPRWTELDVALPASLARYVAEKGSVSVEGVSLTVTGAGADSFGVALVPTTLERTTLGDVTPGDRVNLEVDVVAKYVERLLTAGVGA
ncbi:riboflavin synthase alpha chain [Georgenia satyanarayanai]|uniref:Riboflavin synthase n=1 Tax=Georgenia satyanarayanai TaxID=860221 RepID=A0A2Y8ZZL6_9MICO|nr:riboflavin synthase [Georgenia satyanarayanai]PYG02211.1 riboflavin synthase alpha chain [Georgenia satyanarayanai]SSA37046.1 riboflavin synthase alpha chain [Georgenia satyanarayanai]